MAYRKTKFGALIAGLCLLCCAAPLTALFVGGGMLAGTGVFMAEYKVLLVVAGFLAMSVSTFLILRRHKRNCNSCDVPKR